jgi:hypothetical protein
MRTFIHSSLRSRTMRVSGTMLAAAAIAATAGATLASAQTIVNADRAEISQKIVVGSSTFGDVLRIVGSPSITTGGGTINPAVIDADGDVLEDTFTTVSTAGAYTWSVGGLFSNGLSVGGSLTGVGGTLDIGNVTRFQLTQPQLRFYENDQAANLRYWLLRGENSQIAMEAWDDSISTQSTLWRGYRRASADAYGAAGSADTFEFGANVRNVWPQTNSFTMIGFPNRKFLSLDVDTLRASVFVANETQAFTNGALLVSRGSSLTRDLTAGATTMFVKHKAFRTFDFTVMRGLAANGAPQAEWIRVLQGNYDCTENDADEVAGTGTVTLPAQCGGIDRNDYGYPIERDKAGSGAFAWAKGDAVPSSDRMLDLYSWNSALIPYGGAVIGDKAVVYWNYDGGTFPIPNAARSGGGDLNPGSGAGTGGAGGYPGATDAVSGNGAWFRGATDGDISSGSSADLNNGVTNQAAAFACSGTVELVFHHNFGAGSFVDIASKWSTLSFTTATFVVRSYGTASGLAGQLDLVGANATLIAPRITVAVGWHHLVYTWSNTNGGRAYVDGNLIATSNGTGNCQVANSDPIRTAGWGGLGAGGTHISELALYAYDLSDEQVKSHWRALQTDRAGLFTGPTIAGYERQSDTNWYATSTRWACGNLAGHYDYRRQTYGCAFGDVTGDWTAIDDKGWRLMYQNTPKMQAVGGDLSLTGNLTIGASGIFRSAAATALDTGTGLYMSGGATPLLRVGNPVGNRIRWDGSTLTIQSERLLINSTGVQLTATSTLGGDTQSAYTFVPLGLTGPYWGMYAWDTGAFRTMQLYNIMNSTSATATAAIAVGHSGASTLSFSLTSSSPAGNNVFAIGWPSGVNTSGLRPIVYDPSSFNISIRTDGFTGNCSAATFVVESGVITSC